MYNNRYISPAGYSQILIFDEETNKSKLVYEHRLIYEEIYKCCLLPWANIHHKNGNKLDNRSSNLELMSRSEHTRNHMKGNKHSIGNCNKLNKFKDKTGRICLECLSTNTYKLKGRYEIWRKYKDGWICRNCFMKLYRKGLW